jgi:hypothetical protein
LILEDGIGRDTGWGRDREKGRKGKKERLYIQYSYYGTVQVLEVKMDCLGFDNLAWVGHRMEQMIDTWHHREQQETIRWKTGKIPNIDQKSRKEDEQKGRRKEEKKKRRREEGKKKRRKEEKKKRRREEEERRREEEKKRRGGEKRHFYLFLRYGCWQSVWTSGLKKRQQERDIQNVS